MSDSYFLYCLSLRIANRDMKWFWLDKPVILRKGVWHGLICPEGQVEIKITENSRVARGCYWVILKPFLVKR